VNTAKGTGLRRFEPVTACRVDVPEGRIDVEGTDETGASLEIRYLDRREGPGSEDPVADGAVEVSHVESGLVVRVVDTGRRGPVDLVRAFRRPRLEVRLRLPRASRLEVESVGAPVRIAGCRGDQVVSTVTGDVRSTEVHGRVTVRTVSGSIEVSGATVRADTSTTSGRVRIDAVHVEEVQARSVSGRLELAAGLSPDHEHRLESLSGAVDIETSTSATVVARTGSGRLVAGDDVQRTQWHGASALVCGAGETIVHVRTVSGDIALRRRVASAPVAPEIPPVDAVLAALDALARGEITVDEADRRLAVLHG
jgi:hypothetical protein